MSGLTSAFENPQFSAGIGLIKYAQALQYDKPGGWIKQLKKKFAIFGGK